MAGPTGTCGSVQRGWWRRWCSSAASTRHTFSDVPSLVPLPSNCTRALTFQNTRQALLYADQFLFDCCEDLRALLLAHKELLRECKWAQDIERTHPLGHPGDEDAPLGYTAAMSGPSEASEEQRAEHATGDDGEASAWLGTDCAADAREMVEACSDEETCVVVFQLCAEARAVAGTEAQAGRDREERPGYAWIFLAGKRPRPSHASPGVGAAPSSSLCVRYAGTECQRIRRAANLFRQQCERFRGSFVGSVEHGVSRAPRGGASAGRQGHTYLGRANSTEVPRPRGAGAKDGDAGASKGGGGGPVRCRLDLTACLQHLSDALGVCERILPAIARLGASATRLLLVSDAMMEGVPLGALPTAAGAPLWSHFERNVVTAPSLGFACICRALFEHQRKRAEREHAAAAASCSRAPAVGLAEPEDVDDEEGVQGGRRRRVVAVGAPLGANAVFSGWEARRVLHAFETFAAGGELLKGDACEGDDIRWAARRRLHVPPPLAPERGNVGSASAREGQTGDGVPQDRGAAPCSTVMHLACHGRIAGEDEGGAASVGLLMADRELLRCDNVCCWDLYCCSLVVMSACSSALSCRCRGEPLADTHAAQTPCGTARSQDRALTGASMKLGLPGAFVCAGCPCVVGCLWEVASASTVALMLTFYHVLLSGDRSLVAWPPAACGESKDRHQAQDSEGAGTRGGGSLTSTGGARVSAPEALSTAQVWLQNASMEDVVALLPARGPTAACLRGLGYQTSADPLACRDRRPAHKSAAVGGTGRGEREPVAAKPFESPFYWAGFVCVGEG